MSRGKKQPKRGEEVGYGHPPVHTRFKKGESGNPSGRPRNVKADQTQQLILKEAFRMVNVREGDSIVKLPALQAIFRSLLALAAKGNGPAQRAFIKTVQDTNHAVAAKRAAEINDEPEHPEMSELELARRIAFTLERGARANEREVQKKKKA
jgi:hypothetical protein